MNIPRTAELRTLSLRRASTKRIRCMEFLQINCVSLFGLPVSLETALTDAMTDIIAHDRILLLLSFSILPGQFFPFVPC